MNFLQTDQLAPDCSDDEMDNQLVMAHEASLCWQIRDRRWHALIEPWKTGLQAAFIPSRQSGAALPHTLAFQVARNLIDFDLCRLREQNGELEIRLVSANKNTKEVMARMTQAEKEARNWLLSRHRSGQAFTRLELVSQIVWTGNVPPIASEPVVRSVLDWAKSQGLQSVPDTLFWLTAGFFDQPKLFYLEPDRTNIPTQIAGKCFLVDVLRGKAEDPPEDSDWDAKVAWDWLSRYLDTVIDQPGGFPMGEAMMTYMRTEKGVCWAPGMPIDKALMRQAATETDVCWIARKVQQELDRHQHRRGHRALEIALAMPIEHIEVHLDGFVGSLEESFVKVAQARSVKAGM